MSEIALAGRISGACLIDGTVRKRVVAWSASVDGMLGHLGDRGFGAAPRPLGRDSQGRQVLSWIEGTVPGGPELGSAWTAETMQEAAVTGAARLLRELHDALLGFAPVDACWMYAGRCRLGPGEIIAHGDVGPWNTVYRDQRPVAFIDFDSAGPNLPILEAAQAAWAFVPLASHAAREAHRIAEIDLVGRLKAFADAYRAPDPAQFIAALPVARAQQLARARHWPVSSGELADYLTGAVAELHELEQLMPALMDAFKTDPQAIRVARAALTTPDA